MNTVQKYAGKGRNLPFTTQTVENPAQILNSLGEWEEVPRSQPAPGWQSHVGPLLAALPSRAGFVVVVDQSSMLVSRLDERKGGLSHE